MSQRIVRCPGCGTSLSLPEEIWAGINGSEQPSGPRNCPVRCGTCRHSFQLPRRIPVPDDTIASWLFEEDAVEEPDAPPIGYATPGGRVSQTAVIERLRLRTRSVRLVSLERRGTVFEFSTQELLRPEFRCCFPRVCVHCLGRRRLSAHPVLFSSSFRESISVAAERQAGALVVSEAQLGELTGEALLERLIEVPNVPPPANLPMPYWVCELCSNSGEVSGQITGLADRGAGRSGDAMSGNAGAGGCRLFIRNHQIAAAFFATAGGEGSGDYTRLREFLQRLQEDRWEALPSVVRHRLEQWYRPAEGERFLAYVPDRRFSRSEDGMAGLAISAKRLVYHRSPLHQEYPHDTPFRLRVQVEGDRQNVLIEAGQGRARPITLDRGSLKLLRRALVDGGFRGRWI